ncbi:MAG: hypothetical protein Unbinned767contig1000_6 [Prokaryotic dsDNA virus sp.]|nr:MAG: hypothetical protein Unbinned767contig1000_6 [Prokaryotic dsDNA virus sp.]|tara:strand:+ start:2098 stop:2340 length:243 start_codon:yes stop_codon:yes gene_type:complete
MNRDEMFYRVKVTRTVVEHAELLVRARPGATWEDIQEATFRGQPVEDEVERVTTDVQLESFVAAGQVPWASDIANDGLYD